MESKMMKSEYDLSSAVTLLLVGLGLGSVLTICFGPRTKAGLRPEGINSWRLPDIQRQGEAKERLSSQTAQVRT
jgi:hypothetical protein